MTTITADHLMRSAMVYIRQSTPYQVTNNVESGRRQYGLVERARQLGWNDVQVIDDDLAAPAVASRGRASRNCWQRYVSAALAPCSPSRPLAWRATAAIGIRFWNFVVSWAR